MPAEPDIKRAVSFIDGQNLYRHAKDAFGHYHPNYDPRRLAEAVCADRGWINRGLCDGACVRPNDVEDAALPERGHLLRTSPAPLGAPRRERPSVPGSRECGPV